MMIGLNKRTALAITRVIRANSSDLLPFTWRMAVPVPDPFPQQRWTPRCFDLSEYGLGRGKDLQCALDFAVPSKPQRVRLRGTTCTVHGESCPPDAFIDLGGDFAISCPELIFLEMGDVMNPVEHLMLGHELCGRFSRCAVDPRNGDVAFQRKPVASVESIEAFSRQIKHMAGVGKARHTLRYLNNEAWSPAESLIAALATLPYEDLGYNMGKLELNPRVDTAQHLVAVTERGYRRPDMIIAGTPVGINYDGVGHVDFASIVTDAIHLGAYPGERQAQTALDRTIAHVREKMVDDMNRNRELAADGLVIFPVTKEDLYQAGALDRLMLQICEAIERETGRDMDEQRCAIADPVLSEKRLELVRSLLPGRHGSAQAPDLPA